MLNQSLHSLTTLASSQLMVSLVVPAQMLIAEIQQCVAGLSKNLCLSIGQVCLFWGVNRFFHLYAKLNCTLESSELYQDYYQRSNELLYLIIQVSFRCYSISEIAYDVLPYALASSVVSLLKLLLLVEDYFFDHVGMQRQFD